MRLGTVLLALAILACTPALAQDCAPLKQIASVPLMPSGDGLLAEVSIEGKPAQMFLSTASSLSGFTPSGIAALGLHSISNSSVVVLTTSGTMSESFVGVEDFALGDAHLHHSQFMAFPPTDTADSAGVGALGGDVLSLYDVEMDFAGRKLVLFSHNHCPGKVIYWQHAATAMVPLSERQPTANNSRTGFSTYLERGAQIWVPVTLDGKEFQAVLNTDGPSSMNENFAKALMRIDAASPGSSPLPDARADSKEYQHRFSSLVFDGVSVSNPRFVIYPDKSAAYSRNWIRTDTRLAKVDDGKGPSITIGLDVLRRLHLFASFSEHRLYITEAGPSIAAPATGPANAAPKP